MILQALALPRPGRGFIRSQHHKWVPGTFSGTTRQGRRPQKVISELSHGLRSRCLCFTASVALTAQDSLPAGGHPWPGGTHTRRVRSKGFRDSLDLSTYVISSPFPRLGLAHTWHLSAWHPSAKCVCGTLPRRSATMQQRGTWHPSWKAALRPPPPRAWKTRGGFPTAPQPRRRGSFFSNLDLTLYRGT